MLAFFAAISLWFLPMLWFALAGGDPEHRAYLDNLLFKQTATRYTDAWHHRKPLWYFPEVIAMFWLPFSLAFLWLWRDWREAWRERDARVWLPLAWAGLVLIFFSASPGKRDMYILPALPAVALAAAPFLAALVERRTFQRALLALCVALAALLLIVGIVALQAPPHAVRDFIVNRGLGTEVHWLWVMLVAVGALGLSAALWFKRAGATRAMACLLLAMWCGYGFVAHPVLDPTSSARALMVRARALAGPDVNIGLVAWKEQSLLQAVGPTEEFGYKQPAETQLRRAVTWLDSDPLHRRVLFSQPRGKKACFDESASGVELIGTANRRNWYLVARPAIDEKCFGNELEDQSP